MARTSGVVDVEPVKPRWWRRAILVVLLLAAIAATVWYARQEGESAAAPEVVVEPTDVRSDITRDGDSLNVAVAWELNGTPAQTVPESLRVEVGLTDTELASVSVVASDLRGDTLRVAGPAPGGTASGYSCVTAVHRSRLLQESCTPWQFVTPSAEQMPPPASDTGARGAAAAAPRVLRIVVQPSGLQVDPDVGGRCAQWQRSNPDTSVWVEVNQRAVAACTGPNGKPTVAQFCAFAVLADGRRVLTRNSGRNPYCARLFEAWSGERVT